MQNKKLAITIENLDKYKEAQKNPTENKNHFKDSKK